MFLFTKVRVNGVAPGPIWTPLIPASFPPNKVSEFGSGTPMERADQPEEVAPAYVFLSQKIQHISQDKSITLAAEK